MKQLHKMPELAEKKSGHQPNFSWDEELLHGHVVHRGEVLLHQLLAVLPLSTTCKLMSELKLVKFTW